MSGSHGEVERKEGSGEALTWLPGSCNCSRRNPGHFSALLD